MSPTPSQHLPACRGPTIHGEAAGPRSAVCACQRNRPGSTKARTPWGPGLETLLLAVPMLRAHDHRVQQARLARVATSNPAREVPPMATRTQVRPLLRLGPTRRVCVLHPGQRDQSIHSRPEPPLLASLHDQILSAATDITASRDATRCTSSSSAHSQPHAAHQQQPCPSSSASSTSNTAAPHPSDPPHVHHGAS